MKWYLLSLLSRAMTKVPSSMCLKCKNANYNAYIAAQGHVLLALKTCFDKFSQAQHQYGEHLKNSM